MKSVILAAKYNFKDGLLHIKCLETKGAFASKKYTLEFKLHVVELYLSSEVSYKELALSQGINNPAILAEGVNDFRIVGPDALRTKKKGSKKTLNSENTNKLTDTKGIDNSTVDTSAEHV